MTTSILQPFARLRARARAGIVIEALGILALAGGTFIALSFVLDRTFRLETGYRAALLIVFVAVVARTVYRRLLRPLRVRLTDDELALAVERRDPPLRQALISAVQFARTVAAPAPAGTGAAGSVPRGESRQLMQYVVGEVTERARKIPFAGAIDQARGLRYGALVAILGVGVATWIALDRGTCKLWLRRNVLLSAIEWPRRTHLRFVDQVERLPAGDDLTVRVGAAGEVPEQVRLSYRFAGGERGSEAMTLTGDAEFRATLTSLLEGVTIWATGGDGTTAELAIAIVQRPVLTDLSVSVQPPAYVGGQAEAATTDGDIAVLRGSKLALLARSDKPLQEAFLLRGETQRQQLTVDADGHTVRGEWVPEQTGAVSIDVVDRDLLGSKAPPRLFVRVQDDQAPAVDFSLRGIGSMVTAVARIPGELIVRDDLGLTQVSAWHKITGKPASPTSASGEALPDQPDQPEQPVVPGAPDAQTAEPAIEYTPIQASGLEAFTKGERELRASITVDLREVVKTQPGQILALRFDAADNFGPGDPHTTPSEPAVFRVVTPEELAADLQRRQLEQRKLLEGLLAQHQTARAQLEETMSPSAPDPRAAQARTKLVQLAKTARDHGARVGTIAQSYQQIVEETLNNRLLDAAAVRPQRERVVQPLLALSTDDFPQAATATSDYAASGQDDLRQVALATYDTITSKIKNVLAHMQQQEGLAAVIAELHAFLKLWGANTDEVSRRRGEAGSEVFGPGRDDKDKSPTPKDGDKKQ
jgi:hypothetical protein